MPVGDLRNTPEFTRPRDLLEEPIGVRDVRFDLAALGVVEVALANHQELQLVILEQWTLAAIEVHERAAIDVVQRLEAAFGQDRRLVGAHDRRKKARQLGLTILALLGETCQLPLVILPSMREHEVGAVALEFQLGALEQEPEPAADDLQIGWIQLLLLHQHLLAHANLAEVVEQAGVAQLAQLLPREGHRAKLPVVRAVHHLRQPHRERRHARRMAGRGGIARFDCRDCCRDEPLEQPLDVLVQLAVLDGHGSLRCDGARELHAPLVEGTDVALDGLGRREPQVRRPLAIDQLQHAHDLVAV